MQTEELELEELELEDEVTIVDSGLSSEFFIEGESNIIVENEEVYYEDDPSIIDIEDVISEVRPTVKGRPKNVETALDLLSPEEYNNYVAKSRDYTTVTVAKSLEEMRTRLNFNDNIHFGNQLETLIKESDKFNYRNSDDIIKYIYQNKGIKPRELFEKISPDSTNEAEYYVFKDAYDKICSVLYNEQYKASYALKMNTESSKLLLLKMLDFSIIEKVYKNKDKYVLLKRFYSTDGVVTHFKCEHCSSEEHEHKSKLSTFIYVINVSGKDLSLVLPLVCDSCGGLNVFPPKYIEKVTKDCAKISSVLKTTLNSSNSSKFSYYRSVMDIGVYTPSQKEITQMVSKFNIVDMSDELDLESIEDDTTNDSVNSIVSCSDIEEDWDNIVNRFVDNLKIIGDSKFKLYPSGSVSYSVNSQSLVSDTVEPSRARRARYNFDDKHLKNVTKIFTTMHGNYPHLKSIAVASAINLLKPLGLSRFSLSSKSSYKVYSLIDNLSDLDKRDLEFLSSELGYRIYNEDGSLDESISDNLFNDIKSRHENFDEEKLNFINSMYDSLYYLSYMTLSTDNLSEEDVNDYMYDEDIKLFIDRVSDFMIMTYIAEEWLNKYTPAVNNSDSIDVTYTKTVKNTVKSMKMVNRKKTIRECIARICGNSFGEIHTIMSFVDSADSINYISQFLESCYNRDLYDMYKFSKKIVGNFKSSDLPEFMDLVQLITLFPKVDIDTDKFSFYFPNIKCDNKYKARFVRLFERKGFIPKHLEGDNEEEMLLYYESLDYSVDKVDYLPKEVKSLLSAYDNVVRFGRFISYSNLFKDFAVFYSARDILFSVLINKLSIDKVLEVLNLDPALASMLIEDNYEMPVADSLVVEYIDLLNLPLSDEFNIDAVGQSDKINELLDRYDELRPTFKNFPKLYDLVSSMLKDVKEE